MIKAVLFDLGGTLHVSSNPQGRAEWFAELLINRLADYGIKLDTTPKALAESLHTNSEAYKHLSEEKLIELPAAVIWSDYFLKEFGLTAAQLEPMAEELSFLYDYIRVRVMRRPHLKQTMEQLHGMGIRMGIISNIISRSVVPHFLLEYDIEQYMECQIMSSVTGVRKPSAEIFRVAEKDMDLAPDEMAYVGDTISRDVRGVRNAGWKLMIQINNPSIAFRDAGLEGSGYKPDYLINDLSEIVDIIRRENAE
jgi:putative hydrolase of the HAD superfamily